jgi:hypothetical protein
VESSGDATEADAATLFAAIKSQTSTNDRSSLIAVRDAVRRAFGEYTYLEIGSHLGGTLQPHVLDEACVHLWSIDSRPDAQPDERGADWVYPDNSTARMTALLATLDPTVVDRLHTFDADASSIDPRSIDPAPRLLFVDGEHTDSAVRSDAEFCRRVAHPDGAVIVFHDAQIVYGGLQETFTAWREHGLEFHAYVLPDCVMVLELGIAIHTDSAIQPLLVDNHVGYLASLSANDVYRTMARRFPAKQYWRVVAGVCRRLGRPNPLDRLVG